MQKRIFPVLLTVALVFSSIFSLFSLHNLQGNAKVINYAGVVRGATQRLIKQELNNFPNDALIEKLDGIIDELQTGRGEHGLIRLNSSRFQDLIAKMEADWEQLKEEIYAVRSGGDSEKLFKDSEAYFELADDAVFAAEQYSEKSEFIAEKGLLILNCAFVLMIIFLYIYNSKQLKRQTALREAEEENQRKQEKLSRMQEALRYPLNEISELLYISDPNTYELLFLNTAGMETFHVDSLEGRKCYEVLQGKEAPCEFCTTHLLREGENYTWEFTNPLTNRHYLLKDRLIEWEGRNARMEIAFDTTESEKEKMQLKYTMEADQMVTVCVRTLYQRSDIRIAIPQVLEKLVSFLSADRAYIIHIREGLMYNDYEWCAKGIAPQKQALQAMPVGLIDRWIPFFEKKECVVIEDLEKLKDSAPEEYRILNGQKIKSIVVAPLEQDRELIGYLGVDNPPPERITNIGPLLQTLSYFLMLARQHSESQQQLTHLSYFDVLTGFYNRNRYIEDTQELNHMEASLGIVYLDVNGLKDINDKYGHEFGDKVLIECARRMKVVFKDANFYRIGGDEFVIICPGIDQEAFQALLRELKAQFRKDTNYQAAIGAQWMESIDNIGHIIAAADAHMYEDKRAFYHRHPESNRYRHYNDQILRLADEQALKEELEKGRFAVYLQPKISSANCRAEGAEALIRYCPDKDTRVMPDKFLPLLEEFEIISLIDFFVFRSVCGRLKEWMEQGKEIFPVSVNFSGASLREPSFVEQLTEICRSNGVLEKYMEIEVTERVHDVDGLDMKAVIKELRSAGFTVAIDDFGTEYANLSLLSEVDFDILKLDKSMIDHITTNPKSRAVVETVSKVCHKLGICMVAEGIEEEEQFEILRDFGVELIQGYLFGKPVSIEEFEQRYMD